ncbi:hypothetical protein P280DRAFT_523351 [Massarina eburnea CBS 473.64]|uniref:Uncharacterized protein n=1 Tax=Massarina eburnea CBS 473.64 TaxID=1395130 RepID=A0A6A6RJ12_9PLEO|nr:hypothetical protein P280DRAFT_523351 [Massarina eburnea CBS 473.64]
MPNSHLSAIMKLITILLFVMTALSAPLSDAIPNTDVITLDTASIVKRADRWTFSIAIYETCTVAENLPEPIRFESVATGTFREPNGGMYFYLHHSDIHKKDFGIQLPYSISLTIGPMDSPGSAKMFMSKAGDDKNSCEWHAGNEAPGGGACGGCELKVPDGNSDPNYDYGAVKCTGSVHRERLFDCWWNA